MEVYEYEKCLLTRHDDISDILVWKEKVTPASEVHKQWSSYLELQIQPIEWQAIWKIPRPICEQLNTKYPTIVYGTVKSVIFNTLKAIFWVLAVEDDDIQIPEQHEVNLKELWPTKKQINTNFDIEKIASSIDILRFFYNNVWMPWDDDNDDNTDWPEKYLKTRIRFLLDLKMKVIKKPLAAHIRALLNEARYIQERRDLLEMDLSDDEELNDTLNKSQIVNNMRLHLRLARIKNEIELLQNPELRKIYEETEFDEEKYLVNSSNIITNTLDNVKRTNVYIVTTPRSINQQMELLQSAMLHINETKIIQMCPSLQDTLSILAPCNEIYLPPGKHKIQYLEYLNGNGRIYGLTPKESKKDKNLDVIITSRDDDSILLIFDGDFILENLIFDCKNTRTGIMIKNGTVVFKNCQIKGDKKANTKRGIVVSGLAKIILENSIIKDFDTGLVIKEQATAVINSSYIQNCYYAIETVDGSKISFDNSFIENSFECGILFETKCLNKVLEMKKLICDTFTDVQSNICETLSWTGDCNFHKNKSANIILYNKQNSLFPAELQYEFLNDSEELV